MLYPDHQIFDYPLGDRSHHSTASLQNILQFTKPIVNCIITKELLGSQTNTLDTYFGPRFPILSELYSTIHIIVDPDTPIVGFEYDPQ
jgi:hypothetical protein